MGAFTDCKAREIKAPELAGVRLFEAVLLMNDVAPGAIVALAQRTLQQSQFCLPTIRGICASKSKPFLQTEITKMK